MFVIHHTQWVLTAVIIFTIFKEVYTQCSTAESKRETCINLRRCPDLWSLFVNAPKPMPQYLVTKFKRSQCGVEGNYPKVCCSSEALNSAIIMPVVSETPTHSSVTMHTIFPIVSNAMNDCITKENQPGTCIILQNCPDLWNLLLSSMPQIPSNIKTQLRLSQCGIEGKSPKVCCSNAVLHPSRPPTTTTTVSSIEPLDLRDVTQHSNLHLLPTNCGQSSEERIMNGNKTGILEFPWMTLISYMDNDAIAFDCGGTIISSRYILTAAHCLAELPKQKKVIGIRVGEHNLNTEVDCERAGRRIFCAPKYQDVEIEEVITHKGFTTLKLGEDIGLIRLRQPLNFVDNYNTGPICLPTTAIASNVRLENIMLEVAGWGFTKPEVKSTELLKANLPMVTNSECLKIYESMRGRVWVDVAKCRFDQFAMKNPQIVDLYFQLA